MIEIGSDHAASSRTVGQITALDALAATHSKAIVDNIRAASALDLNVEIDKGVPLPVAKKFERSSPWLPLFKKMSVGDSVLFAGAKITQLGYARTIAKKHDFNIAIRAVTGGVRLWRVAAPGENDDGLGT